MFSEDVFEASRDTWNHQAPGVRPPRKGRSRTPRVTAAGGLAEWPGMAGSGARLGRMFHRCSTMRMWIFSLYNLDVLLAYFEQEERFRAKLVISSKTSGVGLIASLPNCVLPAPSPWNPTWSYFPKKVIGILWPTNLNDEFSLLKFRLVLSFYDVWWFSQQVRNQSGRRNRQDIWRHGRFRRSMWGSWNPMVSCGGSEALPQTKWTYSILQYGAHFDSGFESYELWSLQWFPVIKSIFIDFDTLDSPIGLIPATPNPPSDTDRTWKK